LILTSTENAGRYNEHNEVAMPQMTPQVSEVLEKALTLSTQERGLLIDRLIESLDEGPSEVGVEEAWADEIKRRVDDIRSGKVELIPSEQALRDLAKEFPDE
jgi:putative addiction module component (TIGR02574 family)